MPELTPIDIWSAENNITNPIEQRRGYKEYVIGKYLENDELDEETSFLINKNFADSLRSVNVSEEDINAEFEVKDAPFETKLASVYSYTNPDSEDGLVLREYDIAKELMSSGRLSEVSQQEYADRLPALEEQVKLIVDTNFDKAQLAKVADGSIPFVKIKQKNGKYKLVGGDLASNLTPVEAYKQSLRAGAISPDDALAIKQSYEIPEGESVPYFKAQNYYDAMAATETLLKEDKEVEKWMGALAENIGKQDHYDGGMRGRSDDSESLKQIEQNLRDDDAIRDDVKALRRPSNEQLYGLIIDKMNDILPDAGYISTADKQAAVEYFAGSAAAQQGLLKFSTEEEGSRNLRYFGYKTPVIHRDAFTNKVAFEAMLANSDLSEKQKKTMVKDRDIVIQSMFNEYDQVFKDTHLADDWNRALQRGYSEDKKDGEILDEFLQTADYSGIQNRINAIGSSVVTSFEDIGATIGVLFKSDAAREVIITNQRERDSRRRLANMFGDNFGVAMTLGETAAPVIFDVATTAALTATTGVGGAAYAGAKLTARGVVLGITRGALATAAKETTGAAAKRLVATGIVKGATKEAAIESAEVALKAYAKTTANKYTIRSAMFIPAATRSGGQTYASVYSALDNSPEGKDLTKDEKHSRALAAGVAAAAVTGGITVGFSMLGRGGLEDFILGGATPRQFKAVLSKISGKKFGEGAEFDKIVATYAKNGLKSMWKNSAPADIAKKFTDEALEEAADELVNGYIQSAATGQDVPIIQRLQQSAMAGFYGGVFGGGMGVFQRTAGRFARGGAIEAESRDAAWNKVITDLSSKLAETGSPLAANVILNRLRNPLQKATTAAPKAPAAAAATGPTTAATKVSFDADIKDIDLPEAPVPSTKAPEATTESANTATTPTAIAAPKAPEATTESANTATTPIAIAAPVEPPSVDNKFTAPVFSFGDKSATPLQIPFESTYARSPNGPLETQAGETGLINYSGRIITIFDVGGMKIPFYLSTGGGGKKGVPAGKWYPFFGVGSDGWLNKTGSADINDYYGSPMLRAMATHLNDTVGDVRGNKDIPKTGKKGPAISFINQSLNPVENNTSTTVDDLSKEIARVKEYLATLYGGDTTSVETAVEEDATETSAEEVQKDLEAASASDVQEAIEEALSESSPETPEVVFTYTAPEVDEDVIENATEDELSELEITPSDIKGIYAAAEQQGLTKEQVDKALATLAPQEPEFPEWAMARTRELYEARTKAAKESAAAEAVEAAKAAAAATKEEAAATKAAKAAQRKAEMAAKTASQIKDSKAKKAAEKAAAAEAKAAEKAAAAEAKAASKKAASERKTGKEAVAADPLQAVQIKAIKKSIGETIDTLVGHGFPIRLTKGAAYGMPDKFQLVKSPSEISDLVSKLIYEKYPILNAARVADYSGVLNPEAFRTPQANEFDPVSGKFVERNKQTYYIATEGGVKIGLFDNNPRSMIQFLRAEIPVRIPESFPELLRNKSIRFDPDTRMVTGVFGPTAADPNVLERKDKRNTRKKAPPVSVSKTADDSFELLDGLKPMLDAPMEVHRDLNNIASTSPLDNAQTTFAKASIKVDDLIGKIYVTFRGGSLAGDYSKKEDKTIKKQAEDMAAAMLVMSGIKRANLKGAELELAKETAALELVPEFKKALVFGELFQSLQRAGAIEMVDGRHSIKAGAEQVARDALLERIKVPADFTSAKTDLPLTKDTNYKAAFIYTFGFKKGQSKPILKVGEKNKTKKPAPDWENRVLDSYIDGIINDSIARPDGNGMFPNIKAIASRVGTRALKRVEYAREEKASQDVFALDPKKIAGNIEAMKESEFGELYTTSGSVVPFIFDRLEAGAAAAALPKLFIKPAYELIDFDVEVQQALRALAKDTVHKDSPALAESLKPEKLFKAIAQWAVSKSHSQADSYRFRRQFLDRFKAANESTATISRAFEAYGAYNYDFKRVADKKQRDALIRLGFSEAEVTLLTQESIPTLLSKNQNLFESAAESLHKAMTDGNRQFDAPSFINSKHRNFFRVKNEKEIKRLNLESGNPNSVVAAMKEIMKSSKNKQHRKVAEFLLMNPDLITKTKFSIANIDNNKAGEFSVGSDGIGHVVINMTGYYGMGIESVLLHEYLHAATVDLTTKPESELTDSQRMAKKRLNGLLAISRRAYEKRLADGGQPSLLFESGTQNIEEFIATFFTSTDFQSTLKVTRDAGSRRNFFTRIIDAIKDLFGVRLNRAFDSAFSDLIDLTTIGNIDPASASIEARMDRSAAEAIDGARKFSPIPESVRRPAKDAAYLSAVKAGDMETAQRMVDEAAKKAGFTETVYHIGDNNITALTNNPQDSSFELVEGMPEVIKRHVSFRVYRTRQLGEGFYVSRSPDTWEAYAKDGRDGQVYVTPSAELLESADNSWERLMPTLRRELLGSIYQIKKDHAAETDSFEKKKLESIFASAIERALLTRQPDGSTQFKRQVKSYRLFYNPKNLTVTEDYYRAKEVKQGDVENVKDEEIIVRDFGNLKSADPVTRDESGDVIPLSERFNPESSDIRFASFEPLIDGELGTPQQQRMIDYLIDQAVRSLIPADVAVSVFNTQQEAADSDVFDGRPDAAIVATIVRNADGTEQSAIFINRANMRNALLSRSSVIEDANMAKALLETIINEELTHVAEFNAVPIEKINALVDETLDQEFDGIIDDYTSDPELRASLKEGIRGPDAADVKRQMIGEYLRMYHQRVARGSTTEEDIAFFEGNPNLLQIALRYLRGVFRRTYARYNLNKNNPELAAIIHLMSNELRYLQAGSYSVDGHNAFDPRTPLAGFEVLRRQFAATSVDITDQTTDEEVANRFQSLIDSLDLPVSQYVKGNYKGFSGIVSWFKGELDPRVTRLKKQQIFFENAVEAVAKNYMSKLARLLDKTGGAVDPNDLADAAGSTEMLTVDKDTRLRLSQSYLSALKERKRRVKEGTLDPKYISAEAKSEMRKRMVKDQIEGYRDSLREEVRRKQSAALERIREDYPELADTITEFRAVIDGFSRKLKDTYGLSEGMQLKFDSNMGIYLTRAYRAFNEEGYIDKVLTSSDEQFVLLRERVTPYFKKRYAGKLASALKKQSKIDADKDPTKTKKELTKEQAQQKAEDQVNEDPSAVANFMAQFLRSYEKDYRKRRPLEGGVTKSLIENLKNKGNLDWEVRELLGEYAGPEEAINNMFRTFAVVTSMASRQSFYNNLISIGSMVEQVNLEGKKEMVGFLMTRDELNEKMRNDPAFIASDFVNLRTGRAFVGDAEDTIPKDLAGEYDPTYHYYGPKELIEGMRNAYAPQFDSENKTTSKRAIENMQWLASTLTGLSLGAKTLFSIGFYLRNIVSNMVFFGPSQGYIAFLDPSSYKEMGLFGKVLWDPNNIDETRAELAAFGILNNEITTGLLKDILSGKVSVGKLENDMKDIADKLKAIKDAGSKAIDPLMSRLQALSAAVDGFYKVAYFKHELATLERARQADIDAGNDSYYSRLSDYEMKREAARKVLATAQSYSEAPPVVKEFVRGPGVLVSPFLRFKIEVPRIIWNTYKEGVAEMKSGNPVMYARGAKRMAGMTAMLTLVAGGLGAIAQQILDIGDEEEEVRRRALPSYMQDSSILYFTWGGKLRTVDLTFVNPYALGVDPILRGVEKARRGDISGAAMATLSALWGTYGDQQILAGAISDAYYNRDSKTGQKIYSERDGLGILGKGIAYVLDKSYNPRIFEKAIAAYRAFQAPVVDDQYSALSIVLGEFAPVRSQPVDTAEQYTKLVANASTELRTNRASLNVLRSKRPISDEEIRELAREQIANKVAISRDVFKTTRGLVTSKHGELSINEAAGILKEKGYGPRNINLILNGYIERPTINKELAERVVNNIGDEGLRRLKILQDEFNKEPQFIKFDTK